MSDEPNKKMDEVLRAYARERRKSPEARLTPAMRKLLQAEVKRYHPQEQRDEPGWWTKLRAFWPQIAFGGALGAMLLVAALSLERRPALREAEAQKKSLPVADKEIDSANRRDQPVQLLKQENEAIGSGLPNKAKMEVAPVQTVPQALAGTAPTPVRPLSNEPELRLREEAAAAKDAAADSAASASPQFYMRNPEVMKRYFPQLRPAVTPSASAGGKSSDEVTAGGAAPAKNLATERAAVANELTNLGAARRATFVQIANTSARATGATFPVLQNFQVEQLGQQLRLIDNDGSVYAGAIEAQQTEALPDVRVQTSLKPAAQFGLQAAVAAANIPQNSTVYLLNASGMNRTLGRDVVVTGNYFEQTNVSPANASLTAAPAAPRTASPAQAPAQQQVRRALVGKAIVGKTNQLSIEAVSTEP
ncbi:MAG TPA: hypothetical protein VGR78_04450 [Verrucomicrobiae bacterium]|nr:hypothetical protein [Verrucomicrobiae bacterium]